MKRDYFVHTLGRVCSVRSMKTLLYGDRCEDSDSAKVF